MMTPQKPRTYTRVEHCTIRPATRDVASWAVDFTVLVESEDVASLPNECARVRKTAHDLFGVPFLADTKPEPERCEDMTLESGIDPRVDHLERAILDALRSLGMSEQERMQTGTPTAALILHQALRK